MKDTIKIYKWFGNESYKNIDYVLGLGFFLEETYFFPSHGKKWVFTGKKTFLPGRNGEETPMGRRVSDNNQLIWWEFSTFVTGM